MLMVRTGLQNGGGANGALGLSDSAVLVVVACVSFAVVCKSRCPPKLAANTNNTALVVGEKGAEIIISELGLKP